MKSLATAMRRTNRNIQQVERVVIGPLNALARCRTYRGGVKYVFINFSLDGQPFFNYVSPETARIAQDTLNDIMEGI